MKYRGIIFDLDGVICHTDEYHYAAWEQVAHRLHIPFTPAINHKMRGVDRMASLEIMLGDRGRDFSMEEKERLAAEKNDIYRALLGNLNPASVSPDVTAALKGLRTAGMKLAIGSSSKNTKYILERLGLSSFFDGVADGTSVTRAKPDPEVFLKAAEMVGVPPARCLVVEDAEAGILAATAAGMDSAAVGEAGAMGLATYRLDNLPDLLGIVAEN